MSSQKAKPAVPPTPSPITRAELEAKRGGVLATGPSGAVYRIRQVNLQRAGLEGQLSSELRDMALAAVRSAGGDRNGARAAVLEEIANPEALERIAAEQREMQDRLVLATVIEPKLTADDLGTGELDDDPVLPPIDYAWLLQVAQGDAVRDGQGRMLWGPEPLDRMHVFQEGHGCDPDTCEGCEKVVERFQAIIASSVE